jgi:hypothetical protein
MSSLRAMIRPLVLLLLLSALAACGPTKAPTVDEHIPAFAAKPYEPFNRQDAVAIALREWRVFGQPVDDGVTGAPLQSDQAAGETAADMAGQKPERLPGLWQRVGEYWWIGLNPDDPTVAWTGKHDAAGNVFPAAVDGKYAWSAAFISYVMRIAGAGDRFPYSANHAGYVNAAASNAAPVLKAQPPEGYAPKRGDLICLGRGRARDLKFADLPTDYVWPGHCAIVVDLQPGMLSVIGGNVDDAVTMTHVPISPGGMLSEPDGRLLDERHPWFVVLQVLYDAESEPLSDQ